MQSINIQRVNYSRQQVENNLAQAKDLLAQLDAGTVKPSKIVGAGYSNANKVAYEYLNRTIGRWEMALMMMEDNA